jgi:hypothetical protein
MDKGWACWQAHRVWLYASGTSLCDDVGSGTRKGWGCSLTQRRVNALCVMMVVWWACLMFAPGCVRCCVEMQQHFNLAVLCGHMDMSGFCIFCIVFAILYPGIV